MQIEKSFVIHSGPEEVWGFLTDPRRVARCLPGAEITEQVDEQTYKGTITVKVGPVASSYRGKMHFEELDAAARSAVIVASGQDVRGKGGANLRMSSRVAESGPLETAVAVTAEIQVMGLLAQLGRGMIEDVNDQMFDHFVAAMRGELEGEAEGEPGREEAAPPVEVLSLGAGVVGRAVGRAARRPAFWIALAILAVLLYLVFR